MLIILGGLDPPPKFINIINIINISPVGIKKCLKRW